MGITYRCKTCGSELFEDNNSAISRILESSTGLHDFIGKHCDCPGGMQCELLPDRSSLSEKKSDHD